MPKSVFLFCKSTSPSATQLGLLLVLVLFSFSLACQTQTAADTNKSAAGAADTRAADEATLRKLDDDWSNCDQAAVRGCTCSSRPPSLIRFLNRRRRRSWREICIEHVGHALPTTVCLLLPDR